MKFYDEMPDFEFLTGDTLPVFHVQVEDVDTNNCTMECIVSRKTTPNVAVIIKECTAEPGGFVVQLTSDDTSALIEGTYLIHFRLVDSGLSLRKLMGQLYVHSVAIGGVD